MATEAGMTPEERWALYEWHKSQAEWHTRPGGWHRYQRAWHNRQIRRIPGILSMVIAATIRAHAPRLAANVTRNNALLSRLTRRK